MNRKTKSQRETRGRCVGALEDLDAADLESPMLTTEQAVRTLNVSPPAVLRMIKEERLPAIKLQRRYRIPRRRSWQLLRDRAVSSGKSDE